MRLYDNLGYSADSLAVKKAKVAFRMAYFILDKIAFFLKHYLGLSVSERDAAFRMVWYREGRRRNGLEPVVEGARSWLLRGLFCLSKDLHEDEPVFREALELQETAYRFGHPTSRGQRGDQKRPRLPYAGAVRRILSRILHTDYGECTFPDIR